MRQLTEKLKRDGRNAWGRPTLTEHQQFKVEHTDVGTTRPHYRGHMNERYTFRQSDVGRVIEVITAPNDAHYTCWTFIS